MDINKTHQKFGYARVSTIGQTLEFQITSLKEFGCRKIYREKASGANAERDELKKMLSSLRPGQCVVVTRLDRLARSTFDLFAIIRTITDKKAHFYSISEPWADTTTSTGRLMMTILGGLADVERDLIRIRTGEGRARAVQQGKRMGRPPRITEAQRQEIMTRRDAGEALTSIAQSFGISHSTVSRIARRRGSYSSSEPLKIIS